MTTSTTSPLTHELEAETRAILNRLVQQRRKRVVALPEESVATAERLLQAFSGRELATALAAEGFGTPREVRAAAYRLGQLAA